MATDGPEEAGREGGALVPSVVLPAPSSPECGEGPSSLSFCYIFPIFSFFVIKVGPLNSIYQRRPCHSAGREVPAAQKPCARSQGCPRDGCARAAAAWGGEGPWTKRRAGQLSGETQIGLRPGGARIHLAPRVPREKRRNVDVTRRQGVRMGAPRTQRLDLKNIRALVEASRHICLDVRNLGARRRGPGA